MLGVILLSIFGLSMAGSSAQGGSTDGGRESDPVTEFAAIAPFPRFAMPPLQSASTDLAPYYRGVGPVHWSEAWRLTSVAALAGWTDLHVEVWAAGSDEMHGPMIGVQAIGPLASAPLAVAGNRATASVSFAAVPEREFYYLAVVGVGPDGERELTTWPSFRQWIWYGTPLDFWRAVIAR